MSLLEKQIVDSVQSGTFLEVVHRIYRDNFDEKEMIGKEVAALHNAGKIDIIAEFRKLNSSDQQLDFFMIRHVLEKALPSIDAPVISVMDCVKHLTEEAGNDMAAGTLILPFIAFCEANSARPDEILSAALIDIDDTFDFITPAITAGSNLQLEQYANKAVELCSHENILIRSRAVHALGRIKYHDHEDLIIKFLQAIQTTLELDCDDYLYVAALRSIFALFKAESNQEYFAVTLTKNILQNPTDTILYEASQLFFFEAKILPVTLIDLLLQALISINHEHHGTIRNIDSGLCSLLQRGMQEKVTSFLEEILVQEKQEFSAKQFNGLTREFFENKERSLDILITRWLLSKQVSLGRAAAGLLEDSPDDGIAVTADLDQLQALPEGIRVFLARKACGWFFHKQISAASFIMSLIDTAPNDEIEEITEILFHPLLISYSGSVKDHLVKTVEEEPSEKVKLVINAVLERLNIYHESLESPIDELVPIQTQRETHLRYMSRLMAESYKAARKDSIFLSFTTTSHLLYGSRAVHCFENEFVGQKARQEIPMQEMSHSFEFPALEYLDPHSLDYKLRTFRIEGCDS
ncbi:MAG: hypothetical protein QTN59_07510 [Candidatus Electrothrix communis]|nr:MAG: hypothetical protein QTN59_07510 [Candidatus Electrothrix communis]